jgi:hypothetical protein
MALTAVALGAPATTSPGSAFKLAVIVKDNGIMIGYNAAIPRGVIVTFQATNLGSKTHNFSLLGHTTKALKPHGGKGQFTIDLSHRGAYRFHSTYGTDLQNKHLTGFFTVY